MNESASEIYVIDDDLSVRESVERLIRSVGLNVKTFATAQEILANLGKEVGHSGQECGVAPGAAGGRHHRSH